VQPAKISGDSTFVVLNDGRLALIDAQSICFMNGETGRTDGSLPLPGRHLKGRGGRSGKTVIAASSDQKTLWIWTSSAGAIKVVWPANRKPDLNIASLLSHSEFAVLPFSVSTARVGTISNHGGLLALAGMDREIILYDLVTGKEVRRIARDSRHSERLASVLSFSRDSKVLAWIMKDEKVVNLAEVMTGKWIGSCSIVGTTPTALAFSEDGKSLLVGCDDSTTLVFDLTTLPAMK
jgi:WD40 repeat protein